MYKVNSYKNCKQIKNDEYICHCSVFKIILDKNDKEISDTKINKKINKHTIYKNQRKH